MSLPISDIAITRDPAGWLFRVEAMGMRYTSTFRTLDELRWCTADCLAKFTNCKRNAPPPAENADPLYRIHTMSITPLLVMLQGKPSWHFEAEVGFVKYNGQIADFGGYLIALTDLVQMVSVRAGQLRVKDAGMTRKVLPGRMDGFVLPSDKVH